MGLQKYTIVLFKNQESWFMALGQSLYKEYLTLPTPSHTHLHTFVGYLSRCRPVDCISKITNLQGIVYEGRRVTLPAVSLHTQALVPFRDWGHISVYTQTPCTGTHKMLPCSLQKG